MARIYLSPARLLIIAKSFNAILNGMAQGLCLNLVGRLRKAVFNNLFDSFHNMVAEAKEEREQLDRLLTISTPHERLLVAAIAGVLVVLLAWLVFGSVARSVTLDGALAGAGDGTLSGGHSLQTMVWIKRDAAAQIQPGQPARIEFDGADGHFHTLSGEVTGISVLPMSEFLAMFESRAPLSVHRLLIRLDERPEGVSLARGECEVIIEVGRQSPIARLRMRPS